MADNNENLSTAVLKRLGGDALLKTLQAEDLAWKEGRTGYATLMMAKEIFHDVPVHQFSSGDSPKPLATPSVKDAPIKAK